MKTPLRSIRSPSPETAYSGESTSHSSGPEHEVVYVNEVIYNDETRWDFLPVYGTTGPQYDNLAIAGLNLWSDKEWSSLSELSAFFKYGIRITKPNGETGATNLLPEIVYALLTDESFGAGKLIGTAQVDAAAMASAARYCSANGFTWNGVITDKVNLREWIFEQAAYCLLDFTIIGLHPKNQLLKYCLLVILWTGFLPSQLYHLHHKLRLVTLQNYLSQLIKKHIRKLGKKRESQELNTF